MFEPTPDELERDVGRVVIAWSLIENLVSILLDSVLGLPWSAGRVLIAGRTFSQALDLTIAVIEPRVGDDVSEVDMVAFREWSSRARLLALERNRVAHQLWIIGEDGASWVGLDLTSRRTRSEFQPGVLTHRLPELWEEILASRVQLMDLMRRLQRSMGVGSHPPEDAE